MKIALCDDEKPFLLWFKKKLEIHVPAVQADEFIIDLYSDGRSLLKAQAKQKYNVIFLDIHMPGIDGMAVARQLWQQSGEPIIIFTSEKEELVFQALRVHPFEFLKKAKLTGSFPGFCATYCVSCAETEKCLRLNAARVWYLYPCRTSIIWKAEETTLPFIPKKRNISYGTACRQKRKNLPRLDLFARILDFL